MSDPEQDKLQMSTAELVWFMKQLSDTQRQELINHLDEMKASQKKAETTQA